MGYSSVTGNINLNYILKTGYVSYDQVVIYFNDIWKSEDLGQTWNLVNPAAPWSGRSSFNGIALSNVDILIWSVDMWYSGDGGQTWKMLSPPTGISSLCKIARVNTNYIILTSKSL